MDFTLDAEQEALRDAVRGLLGKAYDTSETRRAVVNDEPGFGESTWSKLAEMGALGLPFAEEDGGMGAGPVEVAIVAEEIGRVIAPEPFVECVVLAGGLVAAAGSDEQRSDVLGRVAEGQLVLGAALVEPGARWDLSGGGVTAERDGDSWTLTGVKEPVLHGARADALVVSAATEAGTGLFLVEGDAEALTRTGYRTMEGGRAAKISFDRTPATPLGDVSADQSTVIDDVVARAQVAYCHEAIGAMDTALRITTDYLKTRKQFGVTLSTFQALTFRAADLYVSMELVRSTVTWATLVLLDEPTRAREAASRAKLQVATAGKHIGEESIQLHGGIGMTAEYSVGHYMSRITAINRWLGDGADHLARLAATLDDHGVLEPLP